MSHLFIMHLLVCLIRLIFFHFGMMFTEMLHLFGAKTFSKQFISRVYATTSETKLFSPHKTSVSSNASYIMRSNGNLMSTAIY